MFGLWLVLAAALAANPPRAASLTRFTYTEYHMGVDARLVVYAPTQDAAVSACSAAFNRIAELDSMMSDYRRDSELSRLSDRAGGPPVRVSRELFDVLSWAQEISRRSGGVFDVTVGPVVQLWRNARKTHVLPAREDLDRARALVGWRKMHLDPKTRSVKLVTVGMRLDLGAIAKGYAADAAMVVLKARGITRALVDLGDIVLSGPPPGKRGWTIALPDASGDKKPVERRLAHCALSSSGDTEQHVVIGGVEYSHVVDPRTGMALTGRVQATVVARNAFTSDPLSTCMTLLRTRDRARLLRAFPGARAYVRVLSGTANGDRTGTTPVRSTP